MKEINNYKEFLDEIEKGARKIKITKLFYEWLRNNVDCLHGKKFNGIDLEVKE